MKPDTEKIIVIWRSREEFINLEERQNLDETARKAECDREKKLFDAIQSAGITLMNVLDSIPCAFTCESIEPPSPKGSWSQIITAECLSSQVEDIHRCILIALEPLIRLGV